MINRGKVYSSNIPQPVEITGSKVYVASNVEEYTQNIEGYELTGYMYDCVEYTKDEYLIQQTNKINELQQELEAAKILLGVD